MAKEKKKTKGEYLHKLDKVEISGIMFDVIWNKDHGGGAFVMGKENQIEIGTSHGEDFAFRVLSHEVMEVVHSILHQRHQRTDCESDYLFSYDHKGFTVAVEMFAGVIIKFINPK